MSANSVKNISVFGKVGVAITCALLLGYIVFSRAHQKFDNSDEAKQTSQPIQYVTVPIEQTSPEIHTLPAGVWSDWYLIMGRQVSIVPASAKVTYELRDAKGNVRVETQAREWNDSTLYERFRSDREIQFFVERK